MSQLETRSYESFALCRERLRWQIDRCETWVNNADTKAAVILGLNGALIAVLFTTDPITLAVLPDFGDFFLGAFVLGVLLSCVSSALSILPNLGYAKSGGSVFHFLDVGIMSLHEFRTISMELGPQEEVEALAHQVHTVSRIVARKYKYLQVSVCSLSVAIVTGLLFVVAS